MDTVANVRIHGETHKQPSELFALEKPHLNALPPLPADTGDIRTVPLKLEVILFGTGTEAKEVQQQFDVARCTALIDEFLALLWESSKSGVGRSCGRGLRSASRRGRCRADRQRF
jgi:hypothetical protein